MADSTEQGGRQSPSIGWVVAEIGNLDHFVNVCLAGLDQAVDATGNVRVAREVDEVLGRPDRFGSPQAFDEALQKATQVESFAKSEWNEGFPYLYGLATVRLWTIMESAIDELVLDTVRLRPQIRELPVIQKLKGPLVSFMSSSPAEQAEFLVNALKEEVRASLHPGVGRFEVLLNAVGLGGPVPDAVRRVFLEMSEVRNVIVHRRGLADAKLVMDRCPWLPFQVGDAVKVRRPVFSSFLLACYWYVLEVDGRLTVLKGSTVSDRQAKLHTHLEQQLVSRDSRLKHPKQE